MIRPEDVTIIIPHLGGTQESEYSLSKCFKSLVQTTSGIKIIVAYNNFQGWDGPVPENSIFIQEQGQCKAVNAAVATTNTPWVFVTNDDMVYPPGWFEKLVAPMTDGDHLLHLYVSPMLIEPRPGAPTFQTYFCGGAGGDFDKQKFLDFAASYKGQGMRTGFNLPFLIHRELWDTIGGYNIAYDPWGSNSDSDLEYKIKLAGVQPMQNTNSIVYHFSQTSGTFEPKNNEYYQKNFAYFEEIWGFPRTDDGIWEATFSIPTKEEGRIFNPSWEGAYGKI